MHMPTRRASDFLSILLQSMAMFIDVVDDAGAVGQGRASRNAKTPEPCADSSPSRETEVVKMAVRAVT
jgi:hypothetical protein